MPIETLTKDLDALAMTVVGEFAAPVAALWDVYADPRQVERFWGPPAFPSRFHRHDMAVGGRSEYVMTGPGGESHYGYWEFVGVDPGERFEVLDGFANPDGSANDELPGTRILFRFEPRGENSRLVTTSFFTSRESFEQLLEMGMESGLREAMAQIDRVLADRSTVALESPTTAELLTETKVRITRLLSGEKDAIWRAHNQASELKQWLLGPAGWTMPVCEVAERVGDAYRYEWEQRSSATTFGFEGELLEAAPPHRAVTTERMIGVPGETRNELTLTTLSAGTLLTLVVTYPNPDFREKVLGTGMTAGMETSYQRLEVLLDSQ